MWPFTKSYQTLSRIEGRIASLHKAMLEENNATISSIYNLGQLIIKDKKEAEVDPLATLRTVEGREVTKIVAIATQAWRDQSEAYKQELNTTTTELGKVNDKLAAAERLLKVAERQVTQRDDQLEAFKARVHQQSRMLEVMAHMDLNLYQQAREQISQEPEHRSDFVEKIEEKIEEKIATLHP